MVSSEERTFSFLFRAFLQGKKIIFRSQEEVIKKQMPVGFQSIHFLCPTTWHCPCSVLGRGSPESSAGQGDVDSDRTLQSSHLNCNLLLTGEFSCPFAQWDNISLPRPNQWVGAYLSSLFCSPMIWAICAPKPLEGKRQSGVSSCPDGWLLSPERLQLFLWVSAMTRHLVSASSVCVCVSSAEILGQKGGMLVCSTNSQERLFFSSFLQGTYITASKC